MISESPYLRAVQTVLHGAGLPGAMAAYGGLTFLTWETESEAQKPLTRSPHRVRAGLFHVAAIGLAITSAALIPQISSGIAWLLAPLVATLLYLGVSSVEVALVEGERDS